MQTALAVAPSAEIENESVLVTSVAELAEVADYAQVATPDDLSKATDLVKLIKTRWKHIEGERTTLVKPLNDTVSRINARFKSIMAPLETAENTLKGKMLTFQQGEARKAEEARREAERRESEEKARLAAEMQDMDRAPLPAPAPIAIQEPPKTTYGAFGGVSTVKKTWAWDLLDIAALAAARPDLVAVDAVKVNAEIRGKGGDIPGLRVFEKETIAVR